MVETELHENAIENFNERANLVRGHVLKTKSLSNNTSESGQKPENSNESDYHPEIITINAEHIVGDIVTRVITEEGQIQLLKLVSDDYVYELGSVEPCDVLTKLLDTMLRTKNISSLVNRSFLEDIFIRWCASESEEGFVGYLVGKIQSSVRKFTVVVPMYQVMLQAPIGFEIEACKIAPISNSQIDDMIAHFLEGRSKERIKTALKGSCAVICNITAESNRAISAALEKASYVSSIFAFYSPYTILPNKKFNGLPAGSEHVPSYDVLIKGSDENLFNFSSGGLSTSELHYVVDHKTIQYMDDCRAKELVGLLARDSLSPFEEKIKTAVHIFVKSAYTTSNTEKLIFGVVCMETIFLRTETESISDSVSRRLAFFLGDNLDSRKEIIGKVKSAYSLRSKYMHHGQTTEDKEVLAEFQKIVFTSLVQILGLLSEYKEKDDFIRDLEDASLS